MKQLKYIVPICLAIGALAAPTATPARDVKVGGGVSTGYEYDDRQYEDEAPTATATATATDQEQPTTTPTAVNNNDESYSRFRIAPLVTLASPGARDDFSLRYSPSFYYDFESSDSDVNHDLSSSLSRYLTKSWQLKLTDNYKLTDRVENLDAAYSDGSAVPTGSVDAPDSTVKLSDSENRRQFWTNNLALRSEYIYLEDSMFSLGYGYSILENIDSGEDSNFENYDRHEVSSALAHRFNPVWKLTVSGSYVRGLFDEAETVQATTDEENPDVEKDLNEYRTATVLESKLFEKQSQSLSYSFFGVDYDASEQTNSTIQDMTLGWQWDYSKDLMFSLGAGPSYAKTEDSDGEWGYNANLALRYAFERGSIGLSANRGFEQQNFTGTDENGLREFWQTRLSMNYEVLENLSANFFSSYRYEDQETITAVAPLATDEQTTADSTDIATTTEAFNRKRVSTGASLDYTFWQWYKASLSYDFSRQDSEKVDDSFDEHRIALTLSYEKEFFNW